MARVDKYDPNVGSFRARLGFQPVLADVGKVYAVSIDSNGEIQKGSATDSDGVIVLSSLLNQKDMCDVFTYGEIVDIAAGQNVTGAAAGVKVYSGAAGIVTNTGPGAGVNGVYIGTFVEAWRLVLRVQQVQG